MIPFEEYLHLLLDLHVAMTEGDESLAEELREKMDDSWMKLSKREIEILDQVSAALYGYYIQGKDD